MLSFFLNPIVSHLVAAALGGVFSWYTTHKTVIASMKADVASVETTIKAAVSEAKSEG